jgi:hypothetical protein
MFRFIVITLSVINIAILTGCNETLDLTKDFGLNWPSCEVHQWPMQPDHITVGGEMIYYVEYVDLCQKEFPNHGGHRLKGEKEGNPRYKDVIDFVCPKCNIAYKSYWEDKAAQH